MIRCMWDVQTQLCMTLVQLVQATPTMALPTFRAARPLMGAPELTKDLAGFMKTVVSLLPSLMDPEAKTDATGGA